MKPLLLLTTLILAAPESGATPLLEVSLATPPPCAAGAAARPLGKVSVPAASAWAEFRVVLCDGRTVDLRTEVQRDGDNFVVVAINRADQSSTNSFLVAGQSFDATLNHVKLRFTLHSPRASAR